MKARLHFSLMGALLRAAAPSAGWALSRIKSFSTLVSFGALALHAQAQSPLADSLNPGANGPVYALAVQSDGRILVGGQFATMGGHPRTNIARLNPDGTLDLAFNPGVVRGLFTARVLSLAVQPDGKILAGGLFSTVGGQLRTNLARLNINGTVDPEFNPGGAGGSVNSLVVQGDGKILVGGSFTTFGGQLRTNIARLNADGTLDPGFNPGANNPVVSLAVQADDKILLGGSFTALGGQSRTNIARLNANGVVDSAFNPGTDSTVNSLMVQADGKILVGGAFNIVGGQSHTALARLDSNGTPDSSFNPGADGTVNSLALQADGKIVVAGLFAAVGGQSRNGIARLNANGTADLEFAPAVIGTVLSLALQANGRILAGGNFSTLGGQTRTNIGRLNNTESATRSLTFNGSNIIWLRGGTSPEVWRTTFDASSNGMDWFGLGDGIRITGGWRSSELALLTGTSIRARGFVAGGYQSASGWFVETITGPPLILSQPTDSTMSFGGIATFSIYAAGTEPLVYQWRKGGVPLPDAGNIAGALTPSLTVSNISGADVGDYSVVVSNPQNSVTSVVARLIVIDPLITGQPAGQVREVGESVTLNVTAVGSPSLNYQWRRGGLALAQGTEATLTLTNLQSTDAGLYTVVVSNSYSSVTSAVAVLTINRITVDTGFAVTADNKVLSMAVQTDGRILVGGGFTMLGGQPRNYIARVGVDGTLDAGFNPAANSSVFSLAVQADGRILVGGNFTTLGAQARTNLARLNNDGTVDPGFNPGANGLVYSLAVQADGKTLVGGSFTTLGGQAHTNMARLNADGSPDSGFNPGSDGIVYSLAVQPDGKILVGGVFRTLGGQPRNRIGRLNTDGTPDLAFNPGADYDVYCLAVQADGKVLVGGRFNSVAGRIRSCIARVSADGSLDTDFDLQADDNLNGLYYVNSLAIQADEKILMGGQFTMLRGQARTFIARVDAEGRLDPGFNPAANNSVSSLVVQADGKILVGGNFDILDGKPREHLARLNSTEPAIQSLDSESSSVTWLRSGTCPEVWRATFEASTNGTTWMTLGAGIRIRGGWQLSGLVLPAGATIRARGFVAGGFQNGSSWFVETVSRPALVISDMFYSANGTFRFSAGGPARQVIVIEASSDLMAWTPLQTNTLGAGPLSFSDLQSALLPTRFYRLRSNP